MTWLTDGTVDVPLSGSTNAEDTTPVVGWEITDAPEGSTATIDPASADQLDITVTGITIVGTYELTLSAADGEKIDDDTVEIRVYSDACAASWSKSLLCLLAANKIREMRHHSCQSLLSNMTANASVQNQTSFPGCFFCFLGFGGLSRSSVSPTSFCNSFSFALSCFILGAYLGSWARLFFSNGSFFMSKS